MKGRVTGALSLEHSKWLDFLTLEGDSRITGKFYELRPFFEPRLAALVTDDQLISAIKVFFRSSRRGERILFVFHAVQVAGETAQV